MIDLQNNIGYLEDGTEVFVVEHAQHGTLYQRIHHYDEYTDEPVISERVEVGKVYDKPMIERYAAEIDRLKGRISELTEQKTALIMSIREFDDAVAKRKAVYSKYPELQHLDALIAGQLTHFVIRRWADSIPEIVTATEMSHMLEKQVGSDRSGELPLFALFGRKTKDGEIKLQWYINRYDNISGDSWFIIPCIDYDEARRYCKTFLDNIEISKYKYRLLSLVEMTNKHDLVLPEDIRVSYEKQVEATRQKRVDDLKAEAEKIAQELNELTEAQP